mgnify:CR=1 FL=1
MATYNIEPERSTLHGHFSRELPPALRIASGDTVIFRTLDAGWGVEAPRGPDYKRREFEPRDEELDSGHALCGPIFVEGAQPGMTLEVRVNALRPGTFGWTVAGGWRSPLNDRIRTTNIVGEWLTWELDPEKLTAQNQYGHSVALRPFMGVMGMPTAEPGRHSTIPPRRTGGNIDCKELVVGSSLFLPVEVEGGLFSVGDGHGLQADGEVGGTAIECPMDVVDLTFTLHEDMKLAMPRGMTPAGWLTFGFSEDLDEAMAVALEGMLDLMSELHGLKRATALALASLLVDLRITQVVNHVRGVHALLPHGALG